MNNIDPNIQSTYIFFKIWIGYKTISHINTKNQFRSREYGEFYAVLKYIITRTNNSKINDVHAINGNIYPKVQFAGKQTYLWLYSVIGENTIILVRCLYGSSLQVIIRQRLAALRLVTHPHTHAYARIDTNIYIHKYLKLMNIHMVCSSKLLHNTLRDASHVPFHFLSVSDKYHKTVSFHLIALRTIYFDSRLFLSYSRRSTTNSIHSRCSFAHLVWW